MFLNLFKHLLENSLDNSFWLSLQILQFPGSESLYNENFHMEKTGTSKMDPYIHTQI